MRPHFRTVSEPLRFAARFRNARDASRQVRPVSRVLRRLMRTLLQRLWMPLHFALRVTQRAAAPWGPPPPRAVAPTPTPVQRLVREHLQLSTRLLERSLRTVQTSDLRLPGSAAPGAHATLPGAPSPLRVLATQRIERQTLFPRVTQVLSRPSPPAPERVRATVASAPPTADPARAPRAEAIRNPAPVTASLAPVELARVTDHVIRQLDRRVLSYRERTGQI